MELLNKKSVVVGLGKSGISSAKLLRSRGADVLALEQKAGAEVRAAVEELERAGARVKTGGYGPGEFAGAELVILSPGVNEREPLYQDLAQKGVEVIGEFELGVRFVKAPVIGVSGTDGKTTTVSLLGEIFERQCPGKVWVGGNIGNPVTGLALGGETPEVVILEVSSFQLAQSKTFHPRAGLMLNIAPDHFDRHPDFEDYYRTKLRLFANQEAKDAAVLNFNDPLVKKMADRAAAQVLWFGEKIENNHGAFVAGRELVYRNERKEFKLNLASWQLPGRHNLENLLGATATAGWFGASAGAIQAGLEHFRAPAHRIEFAGEVGGVKYYDDSKATTPHAVAAALNSFNAPVILMLGGRNKQIDFRPLAPEIKARVKQLICCGEAGREISGQLAEVKVESLLAATMKEGVLLAAKLAARGEVVLLSPGCASFDEFKDYKDRGNKFKAMVKDLK